MRALSARDRTPASAVLDGAEQAVPDARCRPTSARDDERGDDERGGRAMTPMQQNRRPPRGSVRERDAEQRIDRVARWFEVGLIATGVLVGSWVLLGMLHGA